MSDIFDQASDREMMDREIAIKQALQTTRRGITPNGRCYNCMEPLPAGHLFCDADCGTDYQARANLRRR